ncbi:MAG: autotransporter-associated beta strand repeat-containing protein [Kiritimatiellales bacterium]|nr:autotransporter-associated beta strand repeat-containing protein [Kiritimatiellales bacterium]
MFLILAAVLVPIRGEAATGRTVDAKMDFGAIGDGVADDTAALQSALDYLSTKVIKDAGVCLVLPAGTYMITNRLSFAATNPDGAKQGITIRGSGKDGPGASIISSTSTNGALLFNVNDDRNLYNFMVQLEDLQIKAEVADAGPAIEIAKLTGTNSYLRTTPWLRNVDITRTDTNSYFTYGCRLSGVTRPIFDSMKVEGNRPGMLACISITNHYSYDVTGCFLSDADVGVDSIEGGEGGGTSYSTITNVNKGIHMVLGEDPAMSSSGGGVINSSISAHRTGVYIDKKTFVSIHNSVFSNCGGTGAYTNIIAHQLRQSNISDNTFVGGTNQVGIVLTEDRLGTDNQVTIAYNDFGSFETSVLVSTNVTLTKIIDNGNIQSNIVDNGINTYIVHGAMRPFYDSPATHRTEEDLAWNSIATNYAPVINVADYGATGDGVTDDTAAITNAVAHLKTSLDSSGQGTLYFPAGLYKLTQQITLSQGAANWQRIAICGDGSQVSVIEASTATSLFKITCTGQVPTRIHNIRLKPLQLNSGTALELIQQNGTNNGPRSLIMHNVLISATGNNAYFKTGVIGQGLVRPLFQNNWIDLRDYVGATGFALTGGYGFDWQGGKITDVDTACTIDSLGGAVTIRGPGFCSGNIATGLVVKAGGGTFAHYRAHINAVNNLMVSNASEASYMSCETLWSTVPYDNPRTLYFSNCTNIHVRDNFLFSAAVTNRPGNIFVMLDGDKNSNADISGNMLRFVDDEGTGIYIGQGSTNVSVYDNRFFTFPAVDITNNEPTASIALLPMEYRPELVGYWNLEEGSGNAVRGRNYLQQGTVSGAAWVAGKYGTGLHFDGVGDRVSMATPQFAEATNNFTMMVWAKPERGISGSNRGGTQSYVVSGDSPDSNATHAAVNLWVGTNGVRVIENGVTTGGIPDTPTMIDWVGTVSPSEWTHVAVVYSNSIPRLYVNGLLVAAGSASGKVVHPGGSAWGGGAWGWYKGSMDEVRVIDRPLDAAGVLAEALRASILDFNGSQSTGSAFATAADWDGGVAPAKDLVTNIARFNKTSYANQPTNANYILNGLIFGDGTTATADTTISISGADGQQLKLGNNGIAMYPNAGNATINKIQMGADQSWINDSSSILSVGTLGNSDTNVPHTLTLAGSGPIKITGAIGDNTAAGPTAVAVSGGTVTLSGANTFTGGLHVDGGTINYYGTGTTLGRGPVTVDGNVTFHHSNTSATIVTNQMVLNGSVTLNGSANTQWGGTMDLNAGVRTITVSVDSTVASIVSNGGLVKSGTKNLTLSGANTYGGGTTVSAGTLTAAADGALGSGGVTVADGATLVLTNGVSNDYVADTAMLVLGGSSTLTLGFAGTDTVGALSLDGGATWLANGIYSAAALGALGSGSIAVAGVASDPAGTPYGWLLQYGLTNYDADAMADIDGDGLLTWQEYVAGTDPTNSASVFQITGVESTPQGAVIRWSSVSNRFYNLDWTTNLLEGFAVLPGATNLPATPPENVYTNPAAGGMSSFYRGNAHE